jgi:hypothetical protein
MRTGYRPACAACSAAAGARARGDAPRRVRAWGRGGGAPVRHVRRVLHERGDDVAQLQQRAVDVLRLRQRQACAARGPPHPGMRFPDPACVYHAVMIQQKRAKKFLFATFKGLPPSAGRHMEAAPSPVLVLAWTDDDEAGVACTQAQHAHGRRLHAQRARSSLRAARVAPVYGRQGQPGARLSRPSW